MVDFCCYSPLRLPVTASLIKRLKTGMAESQTNISQEKIVKALLTVCPARKRAETNRRSDRPIISRSERNLSDSQKTSLLKTALMQDLLTGKKRVTALLESEPKPEKIICQRTDKTAKEIKLDERNHVEKPLLDQLIGLGWQVLDLDSKQQPGDTFRESFTEVVMLPVLRQQLKVINPWLDDDQVEEVVKQLTASFPSTGLIQNNRHAFNLLLENTSVSENRKTGEKSPTVRFIDFKHRDNNRFIAVCQFKVRILGTEYHIIPDIVLFLNGLPVVVIECKSPKVKEPISEAIDQLLRYSEQRGGKGEGSAPLFYYNQFVITTCRQEAKFGTITTHSEKYFYRWADPYPRSLNDLDHGNSSPNDQQRLVAGMLDRDNLLDLIRTFTLFSTNDKGEMIKVVGRYQQFRAVKIAVKRLLEGKNPRAQWNHLAHPRFREIADHDVHGARDVPAPSAVGMEGCLRHGPHPTGRPALRNQSEHRLLGESCGQHQGLKGIVGV